MGTPGISECCGWPFWGLHCSRLSSYPLADIGKAGSTALHIQHILMPFKRQILLSCGREGPWSQHKGLYSHPASSLVWPHKRKQFDSHFKIVSEMHL